MAGRPGRRDAVADRDAREHRWRQLRQGGSGCASARTYVRSSKAKASPARSSPHEQFGDALRATVASGSGSAGANSTILLMGHRDTVFPKGEPTRRPFKIEDGARLWSGRLRHEGRARDERLRAGGASSAHGGAPAPLVGLFTSDEEIGSPACRPMIEAEARRARAVFNSEPGRPEQRRRHRPQGRRLHAARASPARPRIPGANFSEGISAIERTRAQDHRAACAINDLDAGITVNVGTITGGQTVNTVAPVRQVRDRPALRHARRPRRPAMAAIRRIVETSYRARHDRRARDRRRLPAAGARRRHSQALYRPLRRLRATASTHPVKSDVHRRLRRFRLRRRDGRADDLRRRAGRRQGAQPGGIPRGRQRGAARAKPRARHHAAGAAYIGAFVRRRPLAIARAARSDRRYDVERIAAALADWTGIPSRPEMHLRVPPPFPHANRTIPCALFSPITLADLELPNRIVVAPMCQYSGRRRLRQRLAPDASRHAGEFRRGPRRHRGDACRARRRASRTAASASTTTPTRRRSTRVIAHCKRIGTAKFGVQLAHAGRKASSQRPWEGGKGLEAPMAAMSRGRRWGRPPSRSATTGRRRAR